MTVGEWVQSLLTVVVAVVSALVTVASYFRALEKRVDRLGFALENGLRDEMAKLRERTHAIPSHATVLNHHGDGLKDLEARVRDLEKRR